MIWVDRKQSWYRKHYNLDYSICYHTSILPILNCNLAVNPLSTNLDTLYFKTLADKLALVVSSKYIDIAIVDKVLTVVSM